MTKYTHKISILHLFYEVLSTIDVSRRELRTNFDDFDTSEIASVNDLIKSLTT